MHGFKPNGPRDPPPYWSSDPFPVTQAAFLKAVNKDLGQALMDPNSTSFFKSFLLKETQLAWTKTGPGDGL